VKVNQSDYPLRFGVKLLFAVTAFLFLASVLWVIRKDYDRPWKAVQERFRRLEEKTVKARLASEAKAAAAALERVEKQLSEASEALSDRRAEIASLKTRLSRVEVELEAAEKLEARTRAEREALRYKLEKKRIEKGTDHAATKKVERLYRESVARAREAQRRREETVARRKALLSKLENAAGPLKRLEKERRRLLEKKGELERKLAHLENDLVEKVRNFPIIDFANPSLKIRQFVLPGFPRNRHFALSARVDRCATCHLGIDRRGFEKAPQPFRTHPRLDLYMGGGSPHPLERFGCTICHRGNGRATSFTAAAHTPRDEETRKRWEREYGWRDLEEWKEPMYPSRYVTASCRACHVHEDAPEGGGLSVKGKFLIEKFGCYGCHKIDEFSDLAKVGPNLTRLAEKLSSERAYRWIENPKALRPPTRMPRFFGLENNSDEESRARNAMEIEAMITYLFSRAEPLPTREVPAPGDAKKGEIVFGKAGCLACHRITDPDKADEGARGFGPHLASVGNTTTPKWLYVYLMDPQKAAPGTRMPRPRLTEAQVRDLAAYLSGLKETAGGTPSGRAPVRPDVLDELTVEAFSHAETELEARRQAEALSREEKLLVVGRYALGRYGCAGCHTLPDEVSTTRIGPDFTGQDPVGSKPLAQFDFGFTNIPRTRHDWIETKLASPRVFDVGRLKRPRDRLRMPRFGFKPDRIRALVCKILSFTDTLVKEPFRRRLTPAEKIEATGRRLLRLNNCGSCHRLERDRLFFANPEGARSRRTREVRVEGIVTAEDEEGITFLPLETRRVGSLSFTAGEEIELPENAFLRWEPASGGDVHEEILWALATEKGLPFDRRTVEEGTDEDAVDDWYAFWGTHEHKLPPPLDDEGAMVQPAWLFDYLKKPSDLRPQLDIRMPDFGLEDREAESLAEYFARKNRVSFPFITIAERTGEYRKAHLKEILKARRRFDEKEIQCVQCHLRGDILPQGNEANWGPDMALTPERLRPRWVLEWLTDPQRMRPGTKMPTYPTWSSDERRAMKDFLMNYDRYYVPRAETEPNPEKRKTKP